MQCANSNLSNPHIKDRIRVVRGMVEEEDVQRDVLKSGKVDTIISEPIGVMLLHERMVSPLSDRQTRRSALDTLRTRMSQF